MSHERGGGRLQTCMILAKVAGLHQTTAVRRFHAALSAMARHATVPRAGAVWQNAMIQGRLEEFMKRFDPVTQARIDLTAALRSAARMGLNEGVCNHFSLEMPGDPTKFLINPQGFHWSELTPADLMVVDERGEVVEGKHKVEPTAFFIHGRIHLGKRKKCVLHTHMPFATALTLLDGGELDVYANQSAMRYYGRIGYDREYGGVALANEEGDRISNALGDKSVVFMQHHGVIVCGDNMAYAFDDLYYLERCCMVQVLAQGTGGKLKRVPEKMVAEVARQIESERQQSILHFEALKRLLDRNEPGWSRLT
jgi:ribulose-5-phosphate 4-epimerase/fuculose-1-phosphate aldolase